MGTTKKREWVKTAIIIFLVIMLALTFFSNTIMNYSLPEVAAQYAMSGSITTKIRTSAVVQANATEKVRIEESRRIKAVAVKEGDQVREGDILFYLDDAESSELVNARETLAQLEKQYTLITLRSPTDYYSEERAISEKYSQLAKARAALGEIENDKEASEEAAAVLKAQKDQINEQIKAYNALIKDLNKQISTAQKQQGQLSGVAARPSMDGEATSLRITKAQTALSEAENGLTEAENALASAESLRKAAEDRRARADAAFEKAAASFEAAGGSSIDVASLTSQIDALNKQIRRAKEDYELENAALDKEVEELYDAWVDADFLYYSSTTLGGGSDSLYQKAEAARIAYENRVDEVKKLKESRKLSFDRSMEDQNEQLQRYQMQLAAVSGNEKVKIAYDTAKKEQEAALKAENEAQTALDKANASLDKSKTTLETAKSDLYALERLAQLEGVEATIEGLENQVEAANEVIASLNEQLAELSKDAPQSVVKDPESQKELIESLEKELTQLQHSLETRKKEDALQAQRDDLENAELIEKIEKQRELVAKYEANTTDAKIFAATDGTVHSLSTAKGQETSVGQILCEIVVDSLGYSCEVGLNAEQAKRVRVGDSVSITNAWWSNMGATVVSIRNDPKNPGQNRIATISVTGGVSVGQNLNLTIGERGQTYDTVVPNTAVKEDSNGKFVLTVEAKSSPLGNRYIARRCDVQVLASDETNTAVTGLMGGEWIITTSAKPIGAGTQVRLAESK